MVVKLMVISKPICACKDCAYIRWETTIKGIRRFCSCTNKSITDDTEIPDWCTLETVV